MFDIQTVAAQELVLDALGNGYRRKIIRILNERPRSVAQIATKLPISRPAVSKHLRILEAAKLIGFEVQGAQKLYATESAGFMVIESYARKMVLFPTKKD